MRCELCGKETELFRALVEGTELNACKECCRFGKVLRKAAVKQEQAKTAEHAKENKQEPETVETITSDYSEKIRNAREKRGLKQDEFAKMLSEKESKIQKMETGKYEPSIDTARKMEKILGIKLVEEIKDEGFKPKGKGGEGVTIGDIVKLRKR